MLVFLVVVVDRPQIILCPVAFTLSFDLWHNVRYSSSTSFTTFMFCIITCVVVSGVCIFATMITLAHIVIIFPLFRAPCTAYRHSTSIMNIHERCSSQRIMENSVIRALALFVGSEGGSPVCRSKCSDADIGRVDGEDWCGEKRICVQDYLTQNLFKSQALTHVDTASEEGSRQCDAWCCHGLQSCVQCVCVCVSVIWHVSHVNLVHCKLPGPKRQMWSYEESHLACYPHYCTK